MSQFKSLKKPSLSQAVSEQLTDSISSGAFKPGDKLPSERELMSQFEVSRVTVREALKNLQSLGMIEVKRGMNAGAYVSEPNPLPITHSFNNLLQMGKVDFAHLIDARLYIEPHVAESAALVRTDEDVDRLRDLLERATQLVNVSRKEARLLNVKFHNEVAMITRNPLIVFVSESITQVFSAYLIQMTHTKLGKEGILGLIDEHQSIVTAIAEKKAKQALQRTKEHLLKTYEMYSRIIPEKTEVFIDKRLKNLAGK